MGLKPKERYEDQDKPTQRVTQKRSNMETWKRKSDQLSQHHIALLSPNTGLAMSHLSSGDPGHPSKQQNSSFSIPTFHKDPLVLGMSVGRKNEATLDSTDWLPPWYCLLRFLPAWGL